MKKILVVLLSLSLLLGLSACGDKKEEVVADTKGASLVALFNSLDTSATLEEIANEISAKQETGVDLDMVMPVVPGYLNGFSAEVTNFDEAYVISPMMSQPYIAYVFKTSNKDALLQELEEKHDLRWNICTEADEYQIAEKGDVVFFTMVSNAEE